MVWLTRDVWDYDKGDIDTSWNLETYKTCLDSALITELIHCQDWVTEGVRICKQNAESRHNWLPTQFDCLKTNTCGCL